MTAIENCNAAKVYTKVPDGGWGWVVAAAFFFVEVFTYGIIKSFGVFFNELIVYFDESNSRISWILSICVFVMTFTAPLSTVLSNYFGHRPVVMTGGFLLSLGMVASSFARSVDEMYLTIGLISGLGYCLSFLPTVTLLSQYFDKKRSLVIAVASTGECFAVFAFAPGVLVDATHSYGSAFYSCAAGMALAAICLAFVRPCKNGLRKNKDNKASEETAVTEKPFQEGRDDFLEMDFGKQDGSIKSAENNA